jgi:hypothetical protein
MCHSKALRRSGKMHPARILRHKNTFFTIPITESFPFNYMLKSKFSLSCHFEYANEQITYHFWLSSLSTKLSTKSGICKINGKVPTQFQILKCMCHSKALRRSGKMHPARILRHKNTFFTIPIIVAGTNSVTLLER